MNKNALTAALSLACMEIKSRNEEVINSTWYRIYSLKNWFSAGVSDDRKYPAIPGYTHVWIHENSRALIPEKLHHCKRSKKWLTWHIISIIACSSQDPFTYNESLQHPTIAVLLIKIPLFVYHCSVHLSQSNQCFHVIEFVDRLVVEKL